MDIGVGLNVRRLRSQFLSTFDTTYSLRPIGEVGTVFRRYPTLWKVFISDPQRPGRFKLAAERPSRPTGELCGFAALYKDWQMKNEFGLLETEEIVMLTSISSD